MKIVKVSDLPEVGINHCTEIKKRVVIEKGKIPHLMSFGEVVLRPGQSTTLHKHDTMFELYYIISGETTFEVDGKKVVAGEGFSVIIEPGEMHLQKNLSDKNVKCVYFGVATD